MSKASSIEPLAFASGPAVALHPFRPAFKALRLISVVVGIAIGAFAAPATALADSPAPGDELSIDEIPIHDFDRDHWAWRPLQRPLVPEVDDASWCLTAIDRFILARLQAAGLELSPPQQRAALVRRLSYDLTGLPPTPEEVDAFVSDSRPDAYDRLVDRLLASPEYGQHVAQSWLDVARFAETDGFEHDKLRDDAWQYRDWVVAAMNADLPYDRFIQQQIAGDQIEDAFPGGETATAFSLAGPDMPDINSQEERRDYLLNDITGTIGSVFLGLQVGCAQCHDHKFDPVSQADFYRLRACFEPAVVVRQNVSIGTLRRSEELTLESRLMIRGDWRRRGPVVQPAFPRIANPWEDAVAESQRDQPRVVLARWLSRADHPLTSRVYANRIWQHHFGMGLSTTPSDFGYLGDDPEHVELLDFLATELVDGGWSRKRLDRCIVRSATYRQGSRQTPEAAVAVEVGEHSGGRSEETPEEETPEVVDPQNRLWSHYPLRRLSGEQLRDALLVTSGLLSRRSGGPGVRPPLPAEMVATLLENQWNPSPAPEQHHRRSIYIFARRNLRFPLFEAFDRPDALTSCAARYESTTATQSLVMQNSAFSLEVAEQLAERCREAAPHGNTSKIVWLTRQLYGRAPSGQEQQMMAEFLSSAPDSDESALVDLALALICSNEFRYLD